jgi:hypothetical protein
MAEAAQHPAATPPPASGKKTLEFSVSEIASSRANAWGVRPSLIRAALYGKQRVTMAEAEKLVTDFAKQEAK